MSRRLTSGMIGGVMVAAVGAMAVPGLGDDDPKGSPTTRTTRSGIVVTETRLTYDPANEYDATVDGEYVVYTGTGGGTEDLYRLNLSGGYIPIAFGAGLQSEADMDGDWVAYQDNVGNWNIFAFNNVDLGTTQITFAASTEEEPAISGDNVVFISDGGGTNDIFWYNFDTEMTTPLTMTMDAEELAPAVGGNLAAWHVFESGLAYNLYGIELDSYTQFTIADGPEIEHNASISGDLVAYIVGENVAVYDHGTGLTTPVTDDVFNRDKIVIDGQYVYWGDDRHGNLDIFVHDLSTGQTHQLTDDPYDQILTDATGNRVVYHDDRTGDFAVWSATWEYEQEVPTVSEWGLVVMMLLFLTAGTLVYARRRASHVAG